MVIDRLTVPLERAPLEGYLALREAAPGLVIVANGAGDSGNGTRNHRLLAGLHAIGFSALLIELLTERERRDRRRRSDVALLSRRLAATQHWTQTRVAAARHHVALLGIGPGAAAALVTAAAFPTDVAAVISLSGRPDLAGGSLRAVTAPTLLIVGGMDHALVSRNFDARQHLECPSRLLVISAATHHFDEPGCLEGALSATGSWLDNYVRPPQRAS